MNVGSRHPEAADHGMAATMWRLGPPRRAFWVLLIGALVVSLALPLLTLWRASAAGLEARACMWPAEPLAGAPAQVLIVVPASEAGSVRDGAPNVQIEATMPGMTMPSLQVSDNAPPQRLQGSEVFMAPISVPMSGTWVAQVTVRALGRPVWHSAITFRARSGSWNALPLSTQSASAATLCASPPATAAPHSPVGAMQGTPGAQASKMAERVT